MDFWLLSRIKPLEYLFYRRHRKNSILDLYIYLNAVSDNFVLFCIGGRVKMCFGVKYRKSHYSNNSRLGLCNIFCWWQYSPINQVCLFTFFIIDFLYFSANHKKFSFEYVFFFFFIIYDLPWEEITCVRIVNYLPS